MTIINFIDYYCWYYLLLINN